MILTWNIIIYKLFTTIHEQYVTNNSMFVYMLNNLYDYFIVLDQTFYTALHLFVFFYFIFWVILSLFLSLNLYILIIIYHISQQFNVQQHCLNMEPFFYLYMTVLILILDYYALALLGRHFKYQRLLNKMFNTLAN